MARDVGVRRRPHAWVLGVWALLFGIAAPVTDSVVVGYRIAMTPDRLVGRVESVRTTMSLAVGPLGPLLAGWLIETTSARDRRRVRRRRPRARALGTLSSATGTPSLSELEAAEAQ